MISSIKYYAVSCKCNAIIRITVALILLLMYVNVIVVIIIVAIAIIMIAINVYYHDFVYYIMYTFTFGEILNDNSIYIIIYSNLSD